MGGSATSCISASSSAGMPWMCISWPVTASRRLASMVSKMWKPSDLYSLRGSRWP